MRFITIFCAVGCLIGCKSKDEDSGEKAGPVHSSCNQLDDAGVDSRLDGLTSSDRAVIDLNGHCFENNGNNTLAGVTSGRFIPYTGDASDPIMHIQLFWVPPTETGTLGVFAPDQLTKAECYDVPAGSFCAHVDDNTADDASDDVDLRAKTGSLELTAFETADDGSTAYTANLSMVVWAIDISVVPQQYTGPSVHLEGELRWTH